MRRLLLLCTALAVCAPTLSPSIALAQDDWEVKRDPFDRRIINRYKAILRKNPGDRAALRNISRLYKRYRSIKLLIKEYEKVLAQKPKDFSTLVVLGHLMLESDKDKARGYYERAVEQKPDNPTVQLSLGDLYRATGEPEKARTAYDKALAKSKGKKTKKRILRALADLALDKGDINGAKDYYEKYIALDPKNIQARLDLADSLARHKKYEEAIEVYKKAESKLKSDPAMRVEVISRIGLTHEKAGKEDAAIREYQRAMGMTRKGYYLRKELTGRIIDIYRRRQDLGSLIQKYEKDWKVKSRGHFEWDTLARLYEETGIQQKAIDAFRKAVKKAPYELDTQRRLIALLENSGREEEALKQYEAVIKVAPGEPRFQLELAERYWRLNKESKALAMLKKIQGRFPSDAGVHAALADLYTRWGKDKQALAAYIRLTKIEPREVTHLVNLGEQYFQRNQKKKAIAVWKKIAKGKNPRTLARLGEVYAEHDMLSEALVMFTRAIKLSNSKKSDYFKGRAGVYERQKSYELAIADWETVLSLTPDKKANKPKRREARRRVVGLLRSAGGSRMSDRINLWKRKFKKDPPDIGAAYYLVEAYLRNGKYANARGVLERLLNLAPNDVDAMNQLVKVYRLEHKWDKAIATLEKLIALSPGRERDLYNQIAEIKTILHEDTEAIEYALKALEKSPNDPVAHQRLAERYEDMLQYKKAIEAYEKTIELDARNYKAYFSLARLYLRHDKALDAAKLYREILKRSTQDEILHKAGRHAINLEELTQTMGDLERVVAPLAATFSHKDIYRRILVNLYERYVPSLVGKARRGTKAQRKVAQAELERLGRHGLKPLLEALNDSKDIAQQRIAVGVLGFLGNKGAAPPLVKLAKQPHKEVAGRRKRIGTLRPLLDWDVRVEALVAAGRLGDPRTIPDLIELTKHAEGAMREAATFALGMTGDKRAVSPLLRAMDDSLGTVKTLACLGLAKVADRKAIGRVITAVEDKRRSDHARAACAFTLGALGEKSAVKPLAGVLGEGNDEVQRVAAWALGRIADKRAMPALLEAYFAKRERIRSAVAWALPRVSAGKAATDDVVSFLDYPMHHGKFDARVAIRDLVGTLDPPPLSAELILGHEKQLTGGIQESLRRHRDTVVRVLIDLDARDGGLSLGPITARLGEAKTSHRKSVEQALARIGAAVLADLSKLAAHRDPVVRQRSLSVVAKVGGGEVRAILATGLEDKRRTVRVAAMKASAVYVKRQGKSAMSLVEAVSAKLSAKRWQERKAAAEALGLFGKHSDEAALIRVLASDSKAFVRQAAASSLGNLKRKSSVDALLAALNADSEASGAVRLAAVRALIAIGDGRAKAALAKVARSDPDEKVRRAAKRFH